MAALWHAGAIALLLLAPVQLWLDRPVWTLAPIELPQILGLGLAYSAAALWLALGGLPTVPRALLRVLVALAPMLAASQLLLLAGSGLTRSRGLFLVGSGLAAALLGLVPLVARWRLPLRLLPLGASAAIVAVGLWRGPRPDPGPTERTLTTALGPVSLRVFRNLVGPPEGNGGALIRFGDGWLLVTRGGKLFRLSWDARDNLRAERLGHQVPMTHEAFLADARNDSLIPREPAETGSGGLRLRADTSDRHTPAVSYLRATGLALDTVANPVLLYVAHLQWNHGKRCFTLQVSRSALPALDGDGSGSPPWETVFESHPCLPMFTRFNSAESGGRLAWDSSGRLLLTLGDFGASGLVAPALSQSAEADYGKLLRLDLQGRGRVVAIGLRNPQGLLRDREGRLWETEHGPHGGDELNLIREGANYGWPLATYGTDYGRAEWPLAPSSRNHGDFSEPVYAFPPNTALGSLIELDSPGFPRWKDDLLVASLWAKSLFRVRLAGARVVYVERIPLGWRVRDLAAGTDGRILLWTDEAELVVLAGPGRDSLDANPLGGCLGCHTEGGALTPQAPPLRGIVGKPVGAEPGFSYSGGLRRVGGRWTEARLLEFLRDPERFAPGTGMPRLGIVDSAALRAVVEALKRYR